MLLNERLVTRKSEGNFSVEYDIFNGKVNVEVAAGASIPAANIGDTISYAVVDWIKSATAAHLARTYPYQVVKMLGDKSITYRLVEKIDDGTKVSSSIKVIDGNLVGFSVKLKDLLPLVQEILHDWGRAEFVAPGELC